MTNIEAGGSTVFPEIGVELKPQEVQLTHLQFYLIHLHNCYNNACVWVNLHADNTG